MTLTTQISSTEKNPIRRTSIWILCALTIVLWSTASTMEIWFPLFAQNRNIGALDEIIYTFATMAAVFCWMLAAVLSWRRKNLGYVRWLPLGLLVGLIAMNGLAHWGSSYQDEQVKKAALAGDRVRGYLSSGNETENKAILVYFMDFPGPPPDDSKLLQPTKEVEFTGRRTGGGGEASLSPVANYSLNTPKHLRWYIWHVTKIGEWVKQRDGSTGYVHTIFTDPTIPVVVCEATVPIYISPLVSEIYSDPGKDWKLSMANDLVATFFDDGRAFALTTPSGITGNKNWNEDIMKHLHQGDCK